jgi:tetratricopeptide (TPR) repeat protein
LLPRVTGSLGHVYALSGRIEEGVSALREALAEIDARGLDLYRSPVTIRLGSASLLAGHIEEARTLGEHTLARCRASGERAYEAYALRLLGEVASQPQGLDPRAAEDHFRQALGLASELDMRPLVARCHLGLGQLHRQTGTRQEATEHLATAITMYREMEMGFWLEQAEIALRA